jgi:hypothetical protein
MIVSDGPTFWSYTSGNAVNSIATLSLMDVKIDPNAKVAALLAAGGGIGLRLDAIAQADDIVGKTGPLFGDWAVEKDSLATL